MPNKNRVLTRPQILQRDVTILAGGLEIRRREDSHVSNHPIVNVASEGNESFLVENDRHRWNPGIERQLKSLRGRERIDVMTNVVFVWKHDRRADLHRCDIGNKLFAYLVDNG